MNLFKYHIINSLAQGPGKCQVKYPKLSKTVEISIGTASHRVVIFTHLSMSLSIYLDHKISRTANELTISISSRNERLVKKNL